MEVPAKGPLYDLAAWYRYSVTPGQQGPSVIIGHIDSAENGPSVFYRLGELAPGDAVTVTREDGRTVPFTVYATRSFAKDATSLDVVSSRVESAVQSGKSAATKATSTVQERITALV